MELASDRRYRFAADPGAVWAALAATGEYQRWWPWLRSFDADGLRAGADWRCTIRPPLPYTLRFTIHVDEVEASRRVAAHLSGDIAGTAEVLVAPHGGGSEVRLTSMLAPGNRAFALFATLARPIVRRGHDWVLDTGAEQFAARAVEPRKMQKPPAGAGGFNV